MIQLNLYEQTLKISRHLSYQVIADIIYQICQGLEQLHDNHIIHRDIKLQNIMYCNELVKIVDLGCSNFYGENISRQTTIGTRFYWSPEILNQEEQNDRLDVWCVGVVLYELVFLEQPFNGNDIQRRIRVRYWVFFRNVSIPFQEMLSRKWSWKICLSRFLLRRIIGFLPVR